jgi:tocopherol cyclase
VSADRDLRLAAIPGIFLAQDGDGPHEAFVQILDGATSKSWYIPYPVEDFEASADGFEVRVGPNTFDASGVHLDLPDVGLFADVSFTSHLDGWPVSWASPGAMGPYAYVPFMECFHGVVSFGHSLDGSLTLGDATWSLAGGRGYIEKDWGKAFPAGYLWMHSNHFSEPETSLMASIALIPWMRGVFRGVLIGLKHEGQLYTFATYNRSRTKYIGVDKRKVRWTVRRADGYRLDLTAERTSGALLHAPIRSEMHKRVEETLNAHIHVKLTDPQGAVLLEDVGEVGGLEVHGDVALLLTTGDRMGMLRRPGR